jgi:hypothetical protein
MTTTPEQTPSEPGMVFTDNPLIIDSRTLPFETWSRLDNGNALRLYFNVASPDCTGVHATVRETSDSVFVNLRSGTLPDAVGKICTRVVVPGILDVPLREPLGGRHVLSAS